MKKGSMLDKRKLPYANRRDASPSRPLGPTPLSDRELGIKAFPSKEGVAVDTEPLSDSESDEDGDGR